MRRTILATLTSKGQITFPSELRRAWGLKAGDRVAIEYGGRGEATVAPRPRRSLLDRLEELKLPARGRPLTQAEIDDAVAGGAQERYERSLGKRRR